MEETYKKLKIPIAQVFIDVTDPIDEVARDVVRQVAKKFEGRLAFLEKSKKTYGSDLKYYGLDSPAVYPSFGIASDPDHKAKRWAFEITPDVAPSAWAFFKDTDAAVEKLTAFCEQVLAGTWPEAFMSGPRHTDWKKGTVKQLAWKTWAELESPETPLLLQVHGSYEDEKFKAVEALAMTLEPYSQDLTVATYEANDNHWPEVPFPRHQHSDETDWYWVPKEGFAAATKMPKANANKVASIKAVLQFAAKSSGLEVPVADLLKNHTEAMESEPPEEPEPTDAAELFGGKKAEL